MSKAQVKKYLQEIDTDAEMVNILVDSLMTDEPPQETTAKVTSLIKQRHAESKKTQN